MDILRTILIIIYAVVCVSIIVLTFMQKKGQQGLSGAIAGSTTTDNFYEKNKGRTKEGSLRKWTKIMSISFAVLTIILGIVYVM